MPFYEYQCEHCGHHLEAMQKVSDAPLRKCPACGKSQLKRLMSAPVFRLKGSGWYETDFKSDKEDKRNLAEHPEGKDEKKETAEPVAKESAEGAKAADKKDTPAEKSAEKSADQRAEKSGDKSDKSAAPARPPARRAVGSGARETALKTPAPRAAKPPARKVRPPKKAVKAAGRAARRR